MDIFDEKVKQVINRIKRERERQNISQMDLANKAELSQGFYSDIEAKKSNPTLKTLFKIAKALEIDIRYLFSEEDIDREKIKDKVIKIIANEL